MQLLDPRELTGAMAERLLPPDRMSPSEAARRYLKDSRGDWDPSLAPEMAEPMDEMAGRRYQGIVFVGPQRSSKTFALVFGSLSYIVTTAPGDTMIVQMTQDAARKFSRTDLDRVIRASVEIRDRMSPRARDDNVFDKWFRSGMSLTLGWPASSQLSSKTLRYAIITDYDRPENRDNVDNEGPLWDLTFKRVQTFMSRGKCVAESSPGSDVLVADWKPTEAAPHEAPPASGILSVYNNGTRGRLYWPCLHCNAFMQAAPGLEPFALPSFTKLCEMVGTGDPEGLVEDLARVWCPSCGGEHLQHHKSAMKAAALWVHEGERIEAGRVVGERRRSNIWSGWVGGVAASYQRWDSLLRNYLQAVATFNRTSDESSLRLVSTSDFGAPYVPRMLQSKRGAAELAKRAEIWPHRMVPEGVRFLTAAADIQANRFVIQVHGWGVGLASWLVDRYDISASNRPEGGKFAALDPASYPEDWNLLLPALTRKYVVQDLGVELPILLALVDSGGKQGVTANAYAFWRRINAKGHGNRVQLLKGSGRLEAPRIKKTFPDMRKRGDRKAGAVGDVPVWQINTNVFKDGVANDLAREAPGPGYIHLPDWLNQLYPGMFDELVAEVRTDKGWKNPAGLANEATDLASYNRAAVVALGGERIDWDRPPPWAAPPAEQPDLIRRRRRRRATGGRVVNKGIQI